MGASKQIIERLSDGGTVTITFDPELKRCFTSKCITADMDIMQRWFHMKFHDDLSDIKQEVHGYYKHFFGCFSQEFASEAGEYVYVRPDNYKIEYKQNGYPHHWFTLDEMTKATSECGLAVFRIHEPDPSIDMKKEDEHAYAFRFTGRIGQCQ